MWMLRIAGGDETGSIDDSLYDPTALVLGASLRGEPVIFVSMNYRLNSTNKNILSFPS